MDHMSLKEVRRVINENADLEDDLWNEYLSKRQVHPANHPEIVKLIERINQLKGETAQLKTDNPRWEVKKRDPNRLVYPAFK